MVKDRDMKIEGKKKGRNENRNERETINIRDESKGRRGMDKKVEEKREKKGEREFMRKERKSE
jgi:hypothetical protein